MKRGHKPISHQQSETEISQKCTKYEVFAKNGEYFVILRLLEICISVFDLFFILEKLNMGGGSCRL